MKKPKIVAGVVVAGALVLALGGCGSSGTGGGSAVQENGGTGTAEVSAADSGANDGTSGAEDAGEDLSEQVTIDQEYWHADDDDVTHVIVFTNHSQQTVSVESSSEALDEDGETLGVGDSSTEGIGPNCTSVLSEYIENAKGVQSFKTELTASADEYYDSVIQDLDVKVSAKNGKAIVRITNGGTRDADFVEGYALFLKGGKLVYSDSEYFTNDDSVLKAGKTISKQFEPYDDVSFDSVKVYTTGRADKE